MSAAAPQRPGGRVRLVRIVARVAKLGLGGVAVASLCGFVGWWWPAAWGLDLFNHFRVQYATLSCIAALTFALLRSWRWSVGACVLLGLDLALIVPLYAAQVGHAQPGVATLRLLHFNLLSSNQAYGEVVDHLAQSDADLLFLQEVSPRWAEHLRGVPGYREVLSLPRDDNFGIAVLAAQDQAVRFAERIELGADVPAIEVTIEHPGGAVALLSVHTLPPASASYSERRDQMLRAATTWAAERRASGAIPVILGDLNATPFSRPIRALIADAQLVDSERGFGVQASWPTAPWLARVLLAIPIDHVLHDARLVTVDRVVGPQLGSDHRPVQVELAMADESP